MCLLLGFYYSAATTEHVRDKKNGSQALSDSGKWFVFPHLITNGVMHGKTQSDGTMKRAFVGNDLTFRNVDQQIHESVIVVKILGHYLTWEGEGDTPPQFSYWIDTL